jgi:hypothetical protein
MTRRGAPSGERVRPTGNSGKYGYLSPRSASVFVQAPLGAEALHPGRGSGTRLAGSSVAPLLAVLLVGGALLTAGKVYGAGALLPLLILIAVPLAELALTPVWRWTGAYRYRSPLLFTIARGPDRLELHTGTGYDFLAYAWRARGGGCATRRAVIRQIVQGLLRLIDDIEAARIPPDTRISATSYFFSGSTARRIGCELRATTLAERAHLLLNLGTLLLTYSYVQRRLTVPRVWRAKTAVLSAAALATQKPYFQRLAARLDPCDGMRASNGVAQAAESAAARHAPRAGSARWIGFAE